MAGKAKEKKPSGSVIHDYRWLNNRKAGPLFLETPQAVQKEFDMFLEKLFELKQFPTLPGFAIWCGSQTWKEFYDKYRDKSGGKDDPNTQWNRKRMRVLRSLDRVRTIIEHIYTQLLNDPDTRNAQGPKFFMSAVFKYTEHKHIEQNKSSRTIVLPAPKTVEQANTTLQKAKRPDIDRQSLQNDIAKRHKGKEEDHDESVSKSPKSVSKQREEVSRILQFDACKRAT